MKTIAQKNCCLQSIYFTTKLTNQITRSITLSLSHGPIYTLVTSSMAPKPCAHVFGGVSWQTPEKREELVLEYEKLLENMNRDLMYSYYQGDGKYSRQSRSLLVFLSDSWVPVIAFRGKFCSQIEVKIRTVPARCSSLIAHTCCCFSIHS